MTNMQTFPYGTFPVDDLLREHYTRYYSSADQYPLSDQLPSHHPLLRKLEGTYPLPYATPPWWLACVKEVKLDALRLLLASTTAQEFRMGCLEQARWKAFRATLDEKAQSQLPQSPKLSALIEGTGWERRFTDRGAAETPAHLKLVISTRPLDFLYMSNGRDWESCQDLCDGSDNSRLPSNFYDTGVATAMVLEPQCWAGDPQAILARTTLRMFRLDGQDMVVIGRTYHNNETVAFLLLCQLAGLFDAQARNWGFVSETNALESCRDGYLGPALGKRLDTEVYVEAEPSWYPDDWCVPYVDGGGDVDWHRDWGQSSNDYKCVRLGASIRLMHPRTLPDTPTRINET